MKTVIEMAREAGFETMLRKNRICGFDRDGDYTEELEHFAELVRADALAEQPAQQEPVAIALNTGTKQGVKWLKNVEHGKSLYTSPQPAQQEPIIKSYLKKDNSQPVKWSDYEPDGMHYNKPAQRTWVSLTDEEIQECYSAAYKIIQGRRLEVFFYRVIEAKLKEKNT